MACPGQPDCAEAHGRGQVTANRLPVVHSALGNRGQANYSTAKAGLQGLTKTIGIELARSGSLPCDRSGFIETAMTKATAERVGSDIDQMRAQLRRPYRCAAAGARRRSERGRVLCRQESGYVTGQVLYVDGGRGLR